MICSIHQPNFFPWLGYFNKIYNSDIFVILDDVEYPKSGNSMSSWVNRVAININNEAHWISCPIVREHGKQKICDISINNNNEWKNKLIKTLEYNYKKSDYYHETADFIFQLLDYEVGKLSDLNCYVIEKMCKKLELETHFIKQTDLQTQCKSNNLLIEITKKVECDTYMCGGGASGYQEDALFKEYGINLLYQNYKHPVYKQKNDVFIEGLSIIDVLFNCGFTGTKQLIMENKRKSC